MSGFRDRLSSALADAAAARMRHRYPDWADAMLREHAILSGQRDQFGWAVGYLWASISVSDVVYPVLLSLSIGAMIAYQWSTDEGLVTVLLLAFLGVLIGVARPTRFLVSGLSLGVVVTAVNGFETLSGIRPIYEVTAHSVVQDLQWLVLVLPAISGSALGSRIGRGLPA